MENDDIILRIRELILYLGLNISSFAKKVGISQPNISQILKGNRSCGEAVINKIVLATGCDKHWLLTGEGDIRKEGVDVSNDAELTANDDSNVMIPLIHIDSVGGVHSPNALTASEQYVEHLVPFPDARRGDVAILQSGNSMAPTIPAGAIMQIRRVDSWREYFGYGGDFVLWLTDERRITKQVLKYDPDPVNYVLCHSYNPEAADEELPKSMIQEVWKVVNVLINKGW